ncbi:hypothetical protein AGLY_011538, partial [Aphis glycines]
KRTLPRWDFVLYKTSILRETQLEPVLKIQRSQTFVNVNSFTPSMIGYMFNGLHEIMSIPVKCLMDRSPLNVLEWYVLWKLFDLYYKNFGNYIRERVNVLVVIDSDVDRCNRKRILRNEGSDAVRSEWRFYTFLQNRMYSNLYNCIDLVWFENNEIVVPTIAKCIRDTITRDTVVTVERVYR